MNKNLLTYKKSGVNIDSADKFVNFIAKLSSKKKTIANNDPRCKLISINNELDLNS